MSFFFPKCSANSCALSNKIDLIDCQGVFVLIQIAHENAVYCIIDKQDEMLKPASEKVQMQESKDNFPTIIDLEHQLTH